MTDYENLLDIADKENVKVYEGFNMYGTRLKGLYCDNNIILSKDLSTQAQKSCILAEELGHYYTSVGNILNQKDDDCRKQEFRARLWAFNKKVGLRGIIDCYKSQCMNLYDMAERLNVTEQFLKDALEVYRAKYGQFTQLDNYIIGFEPYLYVLERMDKND